MQTTFWDSDTWVLLRLGSIGLAGALLTPLASALVVERFGLAWFVILVVSGYVSMCIAISILAVAVSLLTTCLTNGSTAPPSSPSNY